MTRERSGTLNFPEYAALPRNAPEVVALNTIYLRSAQKIETLVATERSRNFDNLVRRYIKQLLYGCQRAHCDTPTCYTARKRFSKDSNASRRFSVLSARIIACQLATQPDPYKGLCPGKPVIPVLTSRSEEKPQKECLSTTKDSSFREEIAEDGEDTSNKENKADIVVRPTKEALKEGEVEIITDKGLKDPRSFQQQLFNTKPFKMLEWIGLPPVVGGLLFDFSVPPSAASATPDLPAPNNEKDFPAPTTSQDPPPRFKVHSNAMELIDTGRLSKDSEPVSQHKHQEVMQQQPITRKRRTSSNPTKMTLRDVTPTPHPNTRSKMSAPGAWSHAMPSPPPAPPPGHGSQKTKTAAQVPQITPPKLDKHAMTVQSMVSESGILPPQSLKKLDREICIALYKMCTDTTALKAQKHDAALFARQSLFYVFSTSEALLSSFVPAGSHPNPDDIDLELDDIDQAFRTLFQDESWTALAMQSLWMGMEAVFKLPGEEGRLSDKEATRVLLIALHALAAAVPKGTPGGWFAIRRARAKGRASVPGSGNPIGFEDEMAERLMRKVVKGIAYRCFGKSPDAVVGLLRRYFARCDALQRRQRMEELVKESGDPAEPIVDTRCGGWGLAVCTLEWSRATLLKAWDGQGAVRKSSIVGCCLLLLGILYLGHNSYGLESEFFHMPILADRFSTKDVPVEWYTASPKDDIIHFLDYPYLFPEDVRVTYFRAINLHHMTRAYEQSMTAQRLTHQMSMNTSLLNPHDERLDRRMIIPLTCYLLVEVHRDSILQDALNQVFARESRELRRPLKVRFINAGEEGVDHGGVQQEFFILALREALRPEYGMFTTDEQSRMSWFSVAPLEPIHKFQLIGLLCGLAVYNGVTLPVTFPRLLYRKLLGREAQGIQDIEDGWGALAKSLKLLLDWEDGDVGDVYLRTYEFSYETFGQVKNLNMLSAKEKGIDFLNESFNKVKQQRKVKDCGENWLPVPTATHDGESGEQWQARLNGELDDITLSGDPVQLPSYHVTILEWPRDVESGNVDEEAGPVQPEGEGNSDGSVGSAFAIVGDSGNAQPRIGKAGNPQVGLNEQGGNGDQLSDNGGDQNSQGKGKEKAHTPTDAGFRLVAINSEPEEEAPLVTNKNRKEYVKDYISWLTDRSIRRQYKAFESGFFSIIDPKALTLFTPVTLQALVEGIQEIDITELEKTARYEDGYDINHRVIKEFWSIVRGFSNERRRMLLEFVTASGRVPVNGIGSIMFVIQRNGPDSDRVPTSLTCFGRLLLPEYANKRKLREKLKLALDNSKGFGAP